MCQPERGRFDAQLRYAAPGARQGIHPGASDRPPARRGLCYGAVDFDVIKQDIVQIRDMGFAGVVVGMLDEEGHIDLPRMREVMRLSGNMAVTFHRAFDMCQNPMVALDQLTQLGVARILTSGQQQSAELGLPLLRDLVHASQGP